MNLKIEKTMNTPHFFYRTILLLLVVFSINNSVLSQGSQYFYYIGGGTPADNYSYFNKHAYSGGKIISLASGFDATFMAACVISKIDTNGTLNWMRIYYDGNFVHNFTYVYPSGSDYIACGGEGAALFGALYLPAASLRVLSGVNGTITSSRSYGPFKSGTFGGARATVTKPLPFGAGGAYLFAGECNVGPSGTACGTLSYPVSTSATPNKMIFYLKLANNLDTVLTKRYSINFNYTCGSSVDSTSAHWLNDVLVENTDMVFIGARDYSGLTAGPFGYHSTGYVMKTDFDGNVTWCRTYYIPGNATQESDNITAIVAEGSDYIVVGNSFSPSIGEIFATRINGSNGNVIWCKSYSGGGLITGANFNVRAQQIIKDVKDNNFIISASSVSNGNDLAVFKIDPLTGDIVSNTYSRLVGGNGNEGAITSEIMQAASGSYLLMGSSINNLGTGKSGLLYTKSAGTFFNSSCETPTTITATTRTPVARTPVVRVYQGGFEYGSAVWTTTDYTSNTSTVLNCISTPLSINIAKVDLTCNGSANGTATVTVLTGSPNFTYSWSNTSNTVTASTANTITGLVAGTYSVTVTQASGSTSVTSVTVTQPITVTATANAAQNVSCNGGANGIAIATGGGTGGIIYTWNNGPTTATNSGIGAGSYTVTVKDANNCTATSVVTLTDPPLLDLNSSVTTNVSCFGGTNGSATATGFGGTPTLSYTWNPGNLSGATQLNLPANVYIVQVTDANGCTKTTTVNITQPAAALSATTSVNNNVLCFGASTGSASVVGAGGTTNYSYLWTPTGSTGTTISGLTAGTYVVAITDANNCSTTSSVVITQPLSAITATATKVDASCNTASGSATAIGNGGTGAYTYTWSNGGATGTINNIFSGSYVATVTDGNGCTATTTATVSDVGAATITLQGQQDNICFGGSIGSATVTATGGTGLLTYIWSNGGTTTSISNLPAGSYVISVSDAGGCLATSNITITSPVAVAPTANVTSNVGCLGGNNGVVSVTGSGGTPGYSYSWSAPGGTGSSLNNLIIGTYTVTVTDANGCTGQSNVTLTQPSTAPAVAATSTSTGCGTNTGTAIAAGSGGTPGYNYTWSSGDVGANANGLGVGTYTVTVIDNNGCTSTTNTSVIASGAPTVSATSTNTGCGTSVGTATATGSGGTPGYNYSWSSTDVGATANNLASGIYTVTVTDLNGCTNTTTTSVVASGAPILDPSGAGTICVGQTAVIDATVIGGTPAYTFSWSNGLIGAGPHTVSPTTTTTYTVFVTDASGCASGTYSIIVTVNPPLTLNISNAVQSICNGTSATITAIVTGGSGNYTYTWQPGGQTTPSITDNPTATKYYTVTVDDNCTTPVALATATVNVYQPPVVDFSAPITAGCGTPFCVQFTGTSTGACATEGWNFGDGNTGNSSNPNYCYAVTGVFDVTYTCTDTSNCSGTKNYSGFVNVTPAPVADFTYSPTPVIKQTQTDFTNISTNSNSYLWDFGDQLSGANNTSILTNPSHTYNDTGNYCITLIATATGGCVDTAVKCLLVNEVCNIPDSIPNVFSPNGDVVNDLFLIKSTGLSELICSVYNRWGLKLYEYNAIKTGWDGRTFADNVAPDGTYYYILKATCIDVNKKLEGHGFVQLIR